MIVLTNQIRSTLCEFIVRDCHVTRDTPADIGYWLINKARRQAAELGVQQAARNLRKQGLPLDLALAVLGRK